MSAEPKKDDKKEEKSFPAKLVAVGLVILAVLVFIIYTRATVPEVVNQAGQLVGDTGNALHNFGEGEKIAARGIKNGFAGARNIAIEIFGGLLVIGIIVLIGRGIFMAFFDKGDGHEKPDAKHDAGHDAKKEAKPDAKPAEAKKP